MLFMQIAGTKMLSTRQTSRSLTKFLSLKYYHSAVLDRKPILKYLDNLNSRFNYCLKHSSFSINYCTAYKEIPREGSTFADVENSSNRRKFIYSEHPDVANRSKEEIKSFYQQKNISVKGIDVPKPIMKFSELCLPENLMRVLGEQDYAEPTPIQSLGWPVALSSRDMVGVSQTGSGKTLAYMLPAIAHATAKQSGLSLKKNRFALHAPKILVLGPTRELVQQIFEVSRHFMRASKLFGACVYGGASKSVQLRNLEGAEICIATPGRLLDFLESGVVSLKECSYLVVDEADRMLDMGFEPQIRDIVDQISSKRQTLMWSATWPREIRSLAEDFLTDYIHITVGSDELVANPNIQQNVYVMNERDKFSRLHSFLKGVLENEQCKVLVFVQMKKKVDYLCRMLQNERIPAWGIHGNCSQRQRDDVLHRFRNTTPSVLIATDVASRGLDISDIQHIVNYDLPTNIEDYIHRIGRTARGSACGEAHSFFTSENAGLLDDLLSVLKQANQHINPELMKMTPMASTSKPKNRYQRNSYAGSNRYKPFGRKRMYESDMY